MNLLNEDLDYAAENGYTEAVIILAEEGMDVNLTDVHGRTALYKAAKGGHSQTVKALIECGADANKRNRTGGTALHCAAEYNQVSTVKVLLDMNPEIIDKKDIVGNTALHLAAYGGSNEAIKVLVERGANVNIRNDIGITALDMVIDKDTREIIQNADKIHAKYLESLTKKVSRSISRYAKACPNRQYE